MLTQPAVNDVLGMLPDFAHFMRTFGIELGMMHNDLHLGNIFVDMTNHSLVLIDYGRITFANFYDQRSQIVDVIVQSEIDKNAFLNSRTLGREPPYRWFIDKFARYAKTFNVKYKNNYLCHVLDLITLCGNIECARKLQFSTHDLFDNICKITPNLPNGSGYTITVPSTVDTLVEKYIKFIKTRANVSDKIMAEGLFFLSLYILYMYNDMELIEPTKTKRVCCGLLPQNKEFQFPIANLEKVLYKSFQTIAHDEYINLFLESVLRLLKTNTTLKGLFIDQFLHTTSDGGRRRRRTRRGRLNGGGPDDIDLDLKVFTDSAKKNVPVRVYNQIMQEWMDKEKHLSHIPLQPMITAAAGSRSRARRMRA